MALIIKRKTRNLEKLIKRLNKLNNAFVQSGYFAEQGNHPAADMSYAELMNMHEYGFPNNGVKVPARPVRLITTESIRINKSPWGLPLKNYIRYKSDLEESLNVIGRNVTEIAQSIFGSGKLTANSTMYLSISGKDVNTPLIFDGYLQNNWSWKTSESGILQDLF